MWLNDPRLKWKCVMANLSADLENWMSRLPECLLNYPLIYLAIPGSHDSMTYSITHKSKIAPDAEPAIRRIHRILPCIVSRWAKTQQLDPTDQLKAGIRYFDLRIGKNSKTKQFYFVHGVYCEEITRPLRLIRHFLETHPKEFVILDAQHFYNFEQEDFLHLAKALCRQLGKTFITPSNVSNLNELTLKVASDQKKQALMIYRHRSCVQQLFWPSECYPTPWPNKIEVDQLEEFLGMGLKTRSFETGFVFQCVLTPPVSYILPRFFSSLRATCAKKVNKKMIDWITHQQAGCFKPGEEPKANIFISDFVDMDKCRFSKTVINLNQKIYEQICENERNQAAEENPPVPIEDATFIELFNE